MSEMIERIAASMRIQELEAKLAKAREALRELHAIVWGECPRLLDEDSGGNGELDLKIREVLKELEE